MGSTMPKRLIMIFQKKYISFLQQFRIHDQTFLIILAAVIGFVVGACTLVYVKMLELAKDFFMNMLPTWAGGGKAIYIFVPALGALLLWPFITFFPKETEKDGVPAAMEAVALHNGFMRWTSSLLCMAMSAITLGSGGSAGSEGPIILIGAAISSGVGQLLRVSRNRLRVIVACGSAAGIACIFNAPIAGVLFSLEVVMGEFNIQSFSPIVIASVIATSFSRAFITHGPTLRILPYGQFSAWELILYALMGALAGLVSAGFVRTMQMVEHFFEHHIHFSRAIKPACGALVVGILGFFYPQILGYAYEPITSAIAGNFMLTTLLMLLAVKIVATAFTLGSGGSGGVLCPCLFLGAMLGMACGTIFKDIFPAITGNPGCYGVVGMGAMLGAVIQAPMTAIIMIFELTNRSSVILPMMAACIIASLVHKTILSGSIYTLSLARKGIDIAAGREVGILSSLWVRDVMDTHAARIYANTPYDVILKQCLSASCNYLYVVNKAGCLEGVISFSDLREFVFEENFRHLVVAKDIYNPHVVFVDMEDTLSAALNKFSFIDMEQLPVVNQVNGDKILKGVITQSHVLNAYRNEMLKRSLIAAPTGSAG